MLPGEILTRLLGSSMNIQRIQVISTNVFREVFRDRVLYLAALFGGVLLLAVVLLSEVSAGTENKITLDVGMAAIVLFGLVVTVFLSTALVNKEIEKRTALVLMAKPMSRTEFIVGKHLGLVAVVGILVGLMTAILFAVLSWKQFDYPTSSLAVAAVYILLELSLLTAAGILFGVLTNSLIATLLTFAVYFMGHFSPNLVVLSKSMQNPTVKHLIQALYLVFPDLSRLDLKNEAVYGLLPPPHVLLANAGYGLVYTILLLSIAVWIFSFREF